MGIPYRSGISSAALTLRKGRHGRGGRVTRHLRCAGAVFLLVGILLVFLLVNGARRLTLQRGVELSPEKARGSTYTYLLASKPSMGAVSSPCAVQERMNVWTARAVFLKDHASADPTFRQDEWHRHGA